MPENYSSQGYIDTLLLKENRDIIAGIVILTVGTISGFSNHKVGFWIGLAIGVYFFLSYYRRGNRGEQLYEMTIKTSYSPKKTKKIEISTFAPVTNEPTIADRIKTIHIATNFKCPSCGAVIKPIDMKCNHCGSCLVETANLPKPTNWGNIEVGQGVQINHPTKGLLNLKISYRIYYGEMWQVQMSPDVPWTLTGNYFTGLGLTNEMYLLNWQNRNYLLRPITLLSDGEINSVFAPAARKFAESNQTRNVDFMYAKEIWTITDIGRFRIEFTEGNEITPQPGAIGRFIHAKNRTQEKILVLEDYQMGGIGLDNLRIGYQLQDKDVNY